MLVSEANSKDERMFKDELLKQLTSCKDIDNLILKGHILTEFYLENAINELAIEKLDFNKLKLRFSDKLLIAKVLGLFKDKFSLEDKISLLNKLRNSISHNLHYDKKLFEKLKNDIDPTIYKSILRREMNPDEELILKVGDVEFESTFNHYMFISHIMDICGGLFLRSKK